MSKIIAQIVQEICVQNNKFAQEVKEIYEEAVDYSDDVWIPTIYLFCIAPK